MNTAQARADRRWRRRQVARRWGTWWWAKRMFALPASGLLSIAYGLGLWSPIAGFVALGLGFFIFEWRVST